MIEWAKSDGSVLAIRGMPILGNGLSLTRDPTTGRPLLNASSGDALPAGTTGQFLRHNGSGWVAALLTATDVPLLPWSKLDPATLPATWAPSSHALTAHTVSGLTTGHVLLATGATSFAFGALDIGHATITGTLASARLTGAYGGITGLGTLTELLVGTSVPAGTEVVRVGGSVRVSGTIYATDFVLAGPGGTPSSFVLNSLGDVTYGANPTAGQMLAFVGTYGAGGYWTNVAAPAGGTPGAHDIITAHTASGLTAGHVLRATGATSFAFGALQTTDIPTLGISKITGLQTALDGKAAATHTHTKVQITDFAHAHAWSDITSGVPAYATRWPAWTEVTDKPATFTPSGHGHPISDVTDLQTALDTKLAGNGTNAGTPTSHNFAIGNTGTYNFIQSHGGQPLALNPVGNAVTINGSAVALVGHDHSGEQISSGTLPDARLSSNVPRLDAANAFAQPTSFRALNTAYEPEGVWHANARPSGLSTPSGGLNMRFGYHDYGGGQYAGSLGFTMGGTYTDTLLALQIRNQAQGYNRFQLQYDGRLLWGHGAAAPDANLYRNGVSSLRTDGALVIGASLSVLDGYTVLRRTGNETLVELNRDVADSTAVISMLFHHAGTWSHRLRANSSGFHFINGGSETGSSVYAADFILSSDVRLKEHASLLVGNFDALRGYRYWHTRNRRWEVGVMAQEVERAGVPEAVHTGDDGYMGVAYERLVPLLIETVHELRARVAALELDT